MVEVALTRRPRRQAKQSNQLASANRPAPRQHRRPKDTKRHARTVAPPHEAKTTLGIDFGSGHWSVAAAFGGAKPKSIPLGENFSNEGKRTPANALPTYTRFGGAERFKVLGHDEVSDFTNVSSGLKQSLDDELCTPESEGQKFRDLCKANNVTSREVLTAQLKVVLKFITAELSKRGVSQIDGCRINFTVPVIWTQDDRGTAIQNQISACAIEIGFPDDIAFDVEDFMVDTYFGSQEPSQTNPRGKSRRGSHIQAEDLHIDVGAATTDFTRRAPIGDGGAVKLTGDPDGCAGGMSYFWPLLSKRCVQEGIDFITARRHVFQLCDSSEDIVVGTKTIPVADIKAMIGKCFAEPIRMAQKIVGDMLHVRRIHISGSAPSSNDYIRALWTRALHRDGDQRSTSRGNSALDVRFMPADHATDAVSLAAAIPYLDDPLPRFTAGCFGFLCRDPNETDFIQQVKPPGSNAMSSCWEKVHVDEVNPSRFVVVPCMITDGERLPRKSADTFHAVWRKSFEVTMDPVEFDLAGHVLPGDEVKVRFMRKNDSKEFTLEVDCGNGEVKKKTLELCGDRERIYFIGRPPHYERQANSSAALDPQRPSLSYEGQIESQLEEATQGRDAQPPAPEQATQAAGEQQLGRWSASVDQDEAPADSADEQQTTGLDDSAGRDEASAEQGPERNTPPTRLWRYVYDVPTTPPRQSPGKRKRNVPQSVAPGSVVTTSRIRRRMALDSTPASGADNLRGKKPRSVPGRSIFLDKVLEPQPRPADTME